MLWVLIRSASPKTCCGYSIEAPHRGASDEYPQHMFLWRTGENYPVILTKSSLTIPLLFGWKKKKNKVFYLELWKGHFFFSWKFDIPLYFSSQVPKLPKEEPQRQPAVRQQATQLSSAAPVTTELKPGQNGNVQPGRLFVLLPFILQL